MKTLKRSCVLAVALSALLCAGCGRVGVNSDEIAQANKLCANNEGARRIFGEGIFVWQSLDVECKNGASFSTSLYPKKPENKWNITTLLQLTHND